MNARVLGIVALSLSACSGGSSVTSQTDHLIANDTAQHLGVFSYTVGADHATMFDKNGIELGELKITVPAADRRLLHFELTDGTNDEIEVYRPKTDGTFFAPINPLTATTAAAADPALAPLLARFQVTLAVSLGVSPLTSEVPETLSTTTVCTGGGTAGQPWTYTTPAGCVRAANTSVGCTNVAQLPPTIPTDTGAGAVISLLGYTTQIKCLSGVAAQCRSYPGAGNYSSTLCLNIGGVWNGQCIGRYMISQYIASCPPNTCTSPNYDAVPRQDQCFDPGSCMFQQGTVGCTPYH